jgi:hypothetical protein
VAWIVVGCAAVFAFLFGACWVKRWKRKRREAAASALRVNDDGIELDTLGDVLGEGMAGEPGGQEGEAPPPYSKF